MIRAKEGYDVTFMDFMDGGMDAWPDEIIFVRLFPNQVPSQ
jgi:hypothetical protein